MNIIPVNSQCAPSQFSLWLVWVWSQSVQFSVWSQSVDPSQFSLWSQSVFTMIPLSSHYDPCQFSVWSQLVLNMILVSSQYDPGQFSVWLSMILVSSQYLIPVSLTLSVIPVSSQYDPSWVSVQHKISASGKCLPDLPHCLYQAWYISMNSRNSTKSAKSYLKKPQ